MSQPSRQPKNDETGDVEWTFVADQPRGDPDKLISTVLAKKQLNMVIQLHEAQRKLYKALPKEARRRAFERLRNFYEEFELTYNPQFDRDLDPQFDPDFNINGEEIEDLQQILKQHYHQEAKFMYLNAEQQQRAIVRQEQFHEEFLSQFGAEEVKKQAPPPGRQDPGEASWFQNLFSKVVGRSSD